MLAGENGPDESTHFHTQRKRGRQWAGTKEREMRRIWKVAAAPLS